jgi:hypothetical protein
MQGERDELMKRVFPRLRRVCDQRGLGWAEVDLRWGITDERKGEQGVLPWCFSEINRCRPFFLCMLGERYGWVPERLPDHLLDREPWLHDYDGRSVTELEILHAALRRADPTMEAFFYLRSPLSASSNQRGCRELPRRHDILVFGRAEAVRRSHERQAKLDDLKRRIRQSGYIVRDGYSSPQEFSRLVLADLTASIERLVPPPSDPVLRREAELDGFVASRARVYVDRPKYSSLIDSFVGRDGPGVVVTGASGVGKSALLANWSLRYGRAHPRDLLVRSFGAVHAGDADWSLLASTMIETLNRHLQPAEPVPDEPEALRVGFANALHRASRQRRVVLA